MSWEQSIENSIKRIAGTNGVSEKVDVYYAEVDSVDEASRTCSCTLISGTSDLSLDTVNLMAEVNDGLLRIPSAGSTVYILSSPSITPYVDVFSQLDKIFYVAGGFTFLISDSGIELAGKKYGGIMQITPSVKAWNDLQNDVNDLKQAFAAWTPVANDGGAALKTQLGIFYPTQPLTLTQKSDLENTKVQHGDNS